MKCAREGGGRVAGVAGGGGACGVVLAALERLRRADRYTQQQALRELCGCLSAEGASGAAGLEGTRLLLQHATSLADIKLSLKLYSVLAHALTASEAQYKLIATCAEMYESAFRLLSERPPDETLVILELFACLAYSEGRGRALARHAQDMLRVTGCLRLMAHFFFDKLMYTQTWRALCVCLAECCRRSPPNQAHCSHLVPACVGKCAATGTGAAGQAHAPALALLHALVERHPGNRDLFVRCNGLHLFTREVLAQGGGAQLLCAVTERCPRAARLAYRAGVPQTLTRLMDTHGHYSSVGQWCSIILFQITSGLKCLAESGDVVHADLASDENNLVQHDESVATIEANNEIYQINQNIRDETVISYNEQPADVSLNFLRSNRVRKVHSNINDAEMQTENDKSGANFYHEEASRFYFKPRVVNSARHLTNINSIINEDGTARNGETERSFLNSTNIPFRSSPATSTSGIRSNHSAFVQTSKCSFRTEKARKHIYYPKIQQETKSCQTSFEDTTKLVSNMKSFAGITGFVPAVTSTPRKIPTTVKKISKLPARSALNHINKTQHRTIEKCMNRSIHDLRSNLSRIASSRGTGTVKSQVKEFKNSLGSKLLNTLNASCATVLRGLRSYVLPSTERKQTAISTEASNAGMERRSGNSSFTEYFTGQYMKRRRNPAQGMDSGGVERERTLMTNAKAADESEGSFRRDADESSMSRDAKGCKTCDDTVLLQRKLAENQYLKDTVKKLKIGINTYGCNFKKIAHAFWPDDSSVSPAALYRLYRKLILKR